MDSITYSRTLTGAILPVVLPMVLTVKLFSAVRRMRATFLWYSSNTQSSILVDLLGLVAIFIMVSIQEIRTVIDPFINGTERTVKAASNHGSTEGNTLSESKSSVVLDEYLESQFKPILNGLGTTRGPGTNIAASIGLETYEQAQIEEAHLNQASPEATFELARAEKETDLRFDTESIFDEDDQAEPRVVIDEARSSPFAALHDNNRISSGIKSGDQGSVEETVSEHSIHKDRVQDSEFEDSDGNNRIVLASESQGQDSDKENLLESTTPKEFRTLDVGNENEIIAGRESESQNSEKENIPESMTHPGSLSNGLGDENSSALGAESEEQDSNKENLPELTTRQAEFEEPQVQEMGGDGTGVFDSAIGDLDSGKENLAEMMIPKTDSPESHVDPLGDEIRSIPSSETKGNDSDKEKILPLAKKPTAGRHTLEIVRDDNLSLFNEDSEDKGLNDE